MEARVAVIVEPLSQAPPRPRRAAPAPGRLRGVHAAQMRARCARSRTRRSGGDVLSARLCQGDPLQYAGIPVTTSHLDWHNCPHITESPGRGDRLAPTPSAFPLGRNVRAQYQVLVDHRRQYTGLASRPPRTARTPTGRTDLSKRGPHSWGPYASPSTWSGDTRVLQWLYSLPPRVTAVEA